MPVVDDLERARILSLYERHQVLVGEQLQVLDGQGAPIISAEIRPRRPGGSHDKRSCAAVIRSG